MAGNAQQIDEVVSPLVKQQLADTVAGLAALDKAFIETAKNANMLNEAVGNSKNPVQFAKNAEASNAATKQIIANNDQARLSEIKLQQEREKNFNDYGKKLAKQQADQSKASAAAIAANNKEIDADNKKLAAFEKNQTNRAKLLQKQKDLNSAALEVGAAKGIDSDEFKEAAEKANVVNKQVAELNQSLGNFKDGVGQYSDQIDRSLGRIGTRLLAMGALLALLDILKNGFKALYDIFEERNSTIELTNSLNSKAAEIYAQQAAAVAGLNAEVKAGGVELDRGNQIVGEFNQISPTYFGNLKSIDDLYTKLPADLIAYNNALEITSKIQAAQTLIAENYKRALQDQIDVQTTQQLAQQGGVLNTINLLKYVYQFKGGDFGAADAKTAQGNIKTLTTLLVGYQKQLQSAGGDIGGEQIKAREKSTNEAIAYNKKLIQNDLDAQNAIANSDKNSYAQRQAALKKALDDKLQLITLSTTEELNVTGLTNEQESRIEDSAKLDQLAAQRDYAKQSLDLSASALEKRLKDVKDNEQAVLGTEQASYTQRINAINTYAKKSQSLIKGGVSSGLISPEDGSNRLKALANETAKQLEDAQDKQNELLKKSLEDLINGDKATMETALQIQQSYSERQLQILEDARNKQVALLDAQYAKGKISKQKYNEDLLAIDDQYNIDRLGQIAFSAQTDLESRQAGANGAIDKLKPFGTPTDDQVSAINKQFGIPDAQKAVTTAGINLGNAVNKQGADTSAADAKKLQDEKDTAVDAIQDLQQLQEDASKAIQDEYQNEIELLERKKSLIEASSKSEIEGIQNSILSEKDKQTQINTINAQTAAANAQIAAQEADIKKKAAEAQKLQAEISIIENTAIAILKLPADGGLLGVAAIPIVAALGAAQLATVIAQPIPKFEKGGLTAGGGLIWGERGMEMATLPSGDRMFSPNSATYANMPKGTVITPHTDLLRMIKPDKIGYSGGDQIGWKEVVAALDRNRPEKQKRAMVKVNVYPDRSGLRK
jgi:hypothetical protein